MAQKHKDYSEPGNRKTNYAIFYGLPEKFRFGSTELGSARDIKAREILKERIDRIETDDIGNELVFVKGPFPIYFETFEDLIEG